MRKEPFFYRYRILIGVIFVIIILVLVFALFAAKAMKQKEIDSKKENMELSTLEEVSKGGIYDGSGVTKRDTDLEDIRLGSIMDVSDETYALAKKYIAAYEAMDADYLSGMLTDGVKYDYEAYFNGLAADFSSPAVLIKGFYKYATDTTCTCVVCGKFMAENGEMVYDYEKSFITNFSILDDGSVMPYRSEGIIATDPYLSLGMAERDYDTRE